MLHLLESAKREVVQDPSRGGNLSNRSDCWWWGFLGSTQEEGLVALTRCLQTMWDMGGQPMHGLGIEAELSLPARSRTSPGLPSRMDVPTRDEALARDCAAAVLGATVSGSWRHWCGPRTIPNQS